MFPAVAVHSSLSRKANPIPSDTGVGRNLAQTLLGAGVPWRAWLVSETPPPPPRTCLPPASWFRLFGSCAGLLLACEPAWPGQVRSQACLSCVCVPSICCAVRSTRATFFYHPNWPRSPPVLRSTRCHPKRARQQAHPGKQATRYSCRGSAELFCKTTLESRAGSVFPALPTSTHPLIHALPSSHPHRRGPFSFSPCPTAAPRLSLVHPVFYFPLSAAGSPGSPVQPFECGDRPLQHAAHKHTDGSGPPVAACTNRQR